MTLERVGSEGKFFTDNMILKIMGCVVLAVVGSLIVLAQASVRLPKGVSLFLALLTFVIQLPIYVRKIAMKEKQLKELLEKMSKFEITNTNNFYDSYDFIDEVALHNSGHATIFIEVVRGSTLGMDNEEAKEYYECIGNFKNRILQIGYKYKEINYETENLDEERELMLRQINGAREVSFNLAHNLELKYKYTEKFMQRSIRKERWIFVIISEDPDTQQFLARAKQLTKVLNNYHIQSVSIMGEKEVREFAKEYDDTRLFDIDKGSGELRDILKFK